MDTGSISTTTDGSVGGQSAVIGYTAAKPDGYFASMPAFKLDNDTFHKCFRGRAKGQHWLSFLGKSQRHREIREYARSNRKAKIVGLHDTNNTMIRLQ